MSGIAFSTLIKYFIADLPLLFTTGLCIFLVLSKYLPKKEKWWSFVWFEFFEHLIFPLIVVIAIIYLDSWVAGAVMWLSIVLFCLFTGLFTMKAKTSQDWEKVGVIAFWFVFFIALYPRLLIDMQLFTPIPGWLALVGTNIGFIIWFLRKRHHAS